ncbi:recombinase RecT [Streptomyces sp. NPDC001552]|uniref:recombinase RecT n=1 Tax=Streptomyces sp. NPDC001552 TaxID=3364587 RepID=UPI0036D0A8C3
MALTSLKEKVRAATVDKPVAPVVRLAEVVQDATPEELHAAVQAEGGEAADIVMAWLQQYRGRFETALPSHISVDRFLEAARSSLPGLSRCTPTSLFQAFLACAEQGLLPDGKHAVVTAEDNVATFIPMAQGYVDLMYRSGEVTSVHFGLIYGNEEFTFDPFAPAPHDFTYKAKPAATAAERGPMVLAYAFCWLASGARSQVVLLNLEELDRIRDEYSKSYRLAEESGAKDSFWHRERDRMAEKSAVLRLFKRAPWSTEWVRPQRVTQDVAAPAPALPELRTPTAEDRRLAAEAEKAHEQAEGPQVIEKPGPGPLLRKRSQPSRKTRLERKGRKAGKGSSR